MIMPEKNCALKDAWYSSSLRSSNCSPIESLRPKAVMISCPVKDSSIVPLSRPVLRHCAVNSFCDLLPITPTTIPDSGSATSAISAMSHDR